MHRRQRQTKLQDRNVSVRQRKRSYEGGGTSGDGAAEARTTPPALLSAGRTPSGLAPSGGLSWLAPATLAPAR